MPPRDSAGAGSLGFCEQTPALPGLSQDCPGGQEGSAQQVSSTQKVDTHWVPSSQSPPFGTRVWVGVTVRVLVTVAVAVAVLVRVAVALEVGVFDTVAVAVVVAVAVLVAVAVAVAVAVTVLLAVAVGVSLGVLVGVGEGAQLPSQNPDPMAV
jgi:hypothetical protein